MKHAQKALAAGLLTAASLGMMGSTSQAQTIYAEPGDAGETLATAANTGLTAGTTLTEITGTIGTATDADLYELTISSFATFSASTVNAATDAGGVDTELFLFDASGNPIAANDDANGTTTDSKLPVGNSLYANLTAGTYYIGISESGNEPVNTNNQLLFTDLSQSGDTTAVRGAAGGTNPATLSTFNGNADFGDTGAYEIDFGVTAVPEPSTWAGLVLGGATAGFTFLRRRRAA